MSKGGTVKDVPAQEFIFALAAFFKRSQKLELPAWHDIVKTGTFKELPPQSADWYYVRAASLARRVYLRGGLGMGALTRSYGGNDYKAKGKPHHVDGARGLNRYILQKLQELDLVSTRPEKKGRWLTANGQKELDTIAAQVLASRPKASTVPTTD